MDWPAGAAAEEATSVAELNDLLQYLIEQRGSDLHAKAGSVPHIRVHGKLQRTPFDVTSPDEIEAVVAELLPVSRNQELSERGEVSIAYGISGLGRFRINIYRQRGSFGLSARWVVPGAPAIGALKLPSIVERLASEERGLILVAGPAASGKTTTAAAILDHVNTSRAVHIVTLEDPIEVLHADKQSVVSQREVGTDTRTFAEAMQRVNRLDPDVIFVSELHDSETAAEVLAASASGHLVVAVLNAVSAPEAVAKFLEYVPAEHLTQARHALANNLRGVIAQKLLERADGRGRVPATEVLVVTTKVFDALLAGAEEQELERLIREGEYHGMQTFDQSLFTLYRDEEVSLRDALALAKAPEELRIEFQRAGLQAGY